MRRGRRPVFPSFMVALVLVLHFGMAKPASAFLIFDYYLFTCPELETIVQSGVKNAYSSDSRILASLTRLQFHDCFVNGCDGSILLKNTPTFTGEQSAIPNLNSVRGFNVIDDIKASVEAACPKTVSCADILTIAARDSVVLAGGPYWNVLLGRYDSFSASESDATNHISPAFFNYNSLASNFQGNGLSQTDLVALSGAHTFGKARCVSINIPGNSRLYNWSEQSNLNSGTGKPDPHMNPAFLASIQANCPQGGNGAVLNNLDNSTPLPFDNGYFQDILVGKGLLNSDQALFYQNSFGQSLVETYAANQLAFFRDFTISMTKMGNISPKDASNGEIRIQCGYPNT
jgi:peroxidase